MTLELRVDQIRASDQINTKTEISRGRQGALNGSSGRMITAHRVNGNAHQSGLIGEVGGYSSSTGRTWRAR